MSVSDRILETLKKLALEDGDNAFIQLCSAIDATGKRMYPQLSTAARSRKFIKERLPFVWWTLCNGVPNANNSFEMCLKTDKGMNYIKLEDILYKHIRCTLLHESEMPENVKFTNNDCFAVTAKGQVILPLALLGSLAFSIICCEANKNEIMKEAFRVNFGTKTFNLNDFWGDEHSMREAIRNGFEYDVEKILEQMNKTEGAV